MSHEPFPAFPYPAWRETKETLHRICQIVGKIRMAASPARNHWWHVPLLVSARGLTTGPLRDGDTVFGIDLDLVTHRAEVSTIWGDRAGFALPGKSVAQFHHTLARTLGDLGVTTRVADPRPFDMADEIPFPDDDGHAAYDVSAVGTYWRILAQVDAILREAAAPFPGKQSPVCHYWHTFDIAVGRFSGRPAPARESADPVTREAYSHEVISSRLLVRRRPDRCTGLLLVHRTRARRAGRAGAGPPGRRVGRHRERSPRRAGLRRRPGERGRPRRRPGVLRERVRRRVRGRGVGRRPARRHMTPAWPRRRLQELLGLTHPILQAPMAGAVGPEMAAAVTAAGGLGGVPAGTVSDDRLVADLAAARALVDGPYNVNCFLHEPPAAPSAADVESAASRLAPLYRGVGAEAPAPRNPLPRFEDPRLRAILDLRPAAASFHFGLPDAAAMDALHGAGIVLMASATTVDEAIDLVARGVDVVIAQGAEAGGHRGGTGLVGTMALVPQVVDAVEVPVVAAGGIADGRGVAAALALGADGVQVGTAFLRTPESTMDADQRLPTRPGAGGGHGDHQGRHRAPGPRPSQPPDRGRRGGRGRARLPPPDLHDPARPGRSRAARDLVRTDRPAGPRGGRGAHRRAPRRGRPRDPAGPRPGLSRTPPSRRVV